VQLNENGVEAAAATAILMANSFCRLVEPKPPIDFNCDHPFMFAIVKEGSLPLFIGHFTQC